MWSIDSAKASTPDRLTRSHVGLLPPMPQAAAGNLIEPPVSLPSDPKHRPAAVATAEPLEDAPDHRSVFQGLRGI